MKSAESSQGALAKILLIVASFVIVVAGMRAAQAILVPFLLALFLAVVSAPAFFYLKRRRIPWALMQATHLTLMRRAKTKTRWKLEESRKGARIWRDS